jgi:signal transduction histidine kinase
LKRLWNDALGKWLPLAGVSILVVASATFLTGGLSVLAGNPVDFSRPLYTTIIILLALIGLFPFGRSLLLKGEAKNPEEKQPVLDIATAHSAAAIAAWLRAGICALLPAVRLHIFIYDPENGCYKASPGDDGKPSSDLRFPENSRFTAALTDGPDLVVMDQDSIAFLPEAEQARLELLSAKAMIPLKSRERLLGWIALCQADGQGGESMKNLPRLEKLSRQAATALERIQIEEAMQRRLREMDVLIRVAQGVNVTLALDDIFELIFAQTAHIISFNRFRIILFGQPANQAVVVFSVRGNERLSEEEKTILEAHMLPEYDAVHAGQAYISEDYVSELRLRGIVVAQSEPHAWMAVPLRAGAETIGAVSIGRDEPAAGYTPAQGQTLQAIADLAAGAIIKARLLAESDRRTHQLRTLYEMTRQLSSTLDQELLLKTVLRNAIDILDCEAGCLLIADRHSRELVFRVVLGSGLDKLVNQRIPEDSGIAGRAFKRRETIMVNDVRPAEIWPGCNDKAARFSARSLLAAPMQVKSRVIGVIVMINHKDGTEFSAEDQEMLTAFASQAAVAVENSTLYTMTDQALAARVEELSIMQRIDRELNTSLDINQAMKITLEWAMRQSGAAAGLIGMIESTGIRLMASEGYNGEMGIYQDQLLPAAKVHLGRLLVQKKPIQILRVASGEALLEGAQSQIVVPIQREEEIIGVILVESRQPEGCPQDVVEFLARLGDHASIAIANAQLYNAVQAANVAKSEFVSFVAHELKNPMTSIKGYTELLAARAVGPVNENQANFLQVIRANIDRMNTLISDLNDLSKIEAGRLRLEFSSIVLKDVVIEVERSTRRQIEDKGQRFIIQIPEDLPRVWADRDRLMQILVNLVSNAHKYSDQGGVITLGAQEWLEEKEGGEHRRIVHVWVQDNGIGISAEDQARIFQKFFRSEDPKTREAPGAGLGLNITRSLVEMQGGKIWFESEFRKGTTFNFTVPVAE